MNGSDGVDAVPCGVREMLDGWVGTPAFVRDRYLTVLAANALWEAVSPAFPVGVNLVRATVADQVHRRADPHPRQTSRHVSAALRRSLGRHETDQGFEEIVAEITEASGLFAEAWQKEGGGDGARDAFHFPHEVIGPLRLRYREITLPQSFDLTIVVWRGADEESTAALERLAALPR